MQNASNTHAISPGRRLILGEFKLSVSSVFSFFVALVCATYFSSAPVDVFPDRPNYLDAAEWRSLAYLSSIWDGPIWLIPLSEPFWHLVNVSLGLVLSPEYVVRLLVFFPAFVLYFIAVKHFSSKGSYGLSICFVLLALHPIYISNHFHHLRFALALSFFVLALQSNGIYKRALLLALSPLVHVSFFVFLALLAFGKVSERLRYRKSLLTLMVVVLSAVIVASLGAAENLAVTQLQRYSERELNVGGGMFVVMLFLFFLLASDGRRFATENTLALAFLGLYLSSYWVFPYSRRFLDAGMWFVLIAGLSLSKMRRFAFVAVFGAVVVEFLLRRIHMPYLGFAYDWYYD